MDSPTVISSRRGVAPKQPPAVQPPDVIAHLRGERLGHFELDDYIGVGGMGAVFLARDVRLDRPVALKVLPQRPDLDPDLIQRFENEARAAARLDHENIARVYFFGEDRGVHFIAFEYVEGTNLRDLIEQTGRLPLAEAVNYALQITGALVHSASRDVVHRDIKPSNIIITPSGRAKLVDMGLARRFETDHDGGVTQSGVTLGTFDYISPEQARDPRTADVRSDIYSLGCTLYHMLTGQPPFPEGTIAQKLLAHQAEDPPPPQQRNPQIPDDLAAVIAKMMAKQPRRRYRDPEQLYRDLLLVAGALGLRSTSPEGLIWMSPTRPHVPAWERHAPLAIPLVTLLAVALVLFFWPPGGMVTTPDTAAEGPGPVALNKNTSVAPKTSEAGNRSTRPEVLEDSLAGRFDTGGTETASRQPNEVTSPSAMQRGPLTSAEGTSPGATVAETPATNGNAKPVGSLDLGRERAGSAAEASSSAAVSNDSGTEGNVVPVLPNPRLVSGGSTVPGISGAGVRADRVLEQPATNSSSPSTISQGASPGRSQPEVVASPRDNPRDGVNSKGPDRSSTETPSTGALPADGSRTVAPSVPAVEPMPPPTRPNTLVVDPRSTGERVYDSLEAALDGAASDTASVIELRYNGRRQEAPIKINGIRVTVRPAEGFNPVVVLVPKKIPTQGYRTRMITISGGSLSLVGVHLEVQIPSSNNGPWSLFHVQNAEKLSLSDCTVTLVNPTAQDAALIEVASISPPAVPLSNLSGELPRNPIELDIHDSFLRAEGDVVLVREPQAVRVNLTNVVACASGQLLHVKGGTQPQPGEHIELKVEHVSARTDNGLVLLEATESTHLVPLRMTTSNNIFQTQSLVAEASPLVKVVGPRDLDSLGGLIQDDRSVGVNNFYEGYEIFREIVSDSGNMIMMSAGKSTWKFDSWRNFRGSQESEPQSNQVRWATPPTAGSSAAMNLADWVLAEMPNPAREAASDGTDAGANLDEIPEPPASTSTN